MVRVSWSKSTILLGYGLFCKCVIHICISHVIYICICVAAVAEEVMYEVVAEPLEPLEQAQQEKRCENPAQGPVHPSTEQQAEGKPRCITSNLNLCNVRRPDPKDRG